MIVRIRLLLACLYFVILCECDIFPHVSLQQGSVIGKRLTTRKGRVVDGFTGIPYAKPPIGQLRFKAPVPLDSWCGVLNATQPHSVCPQPNYYDPKIPFIGNEDCLYLNVYTPKVSINKLNDSLYPVLFYIHGGTFSIGSARDDWLGPELLLDQDLVLVTVNYRLGVLGFLTTGDDIIPANNGLKDQALALKWVNKNIINFGGDPKKVTICGNSAGGTSAHYHTFSPLSKDLVNKAILQSGTAFLPPSTTTITDSIINAHELGNRSNCSFPSSSELLKCLLKLSAYEIVKQQITFSTFDVSAAPFLPVTEEDHPDAFISKRILQPNNTADIPIMTGIVPFEGLFISGGMSSVDLHNMDNNFGPQVMKDFKISSLSATDILRKFYFGNKTIGNDTIPQITDLYTDGWFTWEADYLVRTHLLYKTQPVYLYYFDYLGSVSYANIYPTFDFVKGPTHTDELFYLLPRKISFPHYCPTVSDDAVTDIMTTLWYNFIQYGNPTPASKSSIPKWNNVVSENLEYYHIEGPSLLGMKDKLMIDRVKLWQTMPIDKVG